MAKEDYVVRLEEEYSQLKERIVKLIAFIEGPKFTCLFPFEQNDLREQLQVMFEYQKILFKRLARIYGRQTES